MTEYERVERAARAICAAWGYVWDADSTDPQGTGDDGNVYDDRPSKRLYLEAAEAALTAGEEKQHA